MQFLHIASASLPELDTQLELAARLGYVTASADLREQIDRVQAQKLAMIQSLKRRSR